MISYIITKILHLPRTLENADLAEGISPPVALKMSMKNCTILLN